MWCGLAFADGEEDVGDLEDIVKILLGARTVFKDFVLVACYFESLFGLFKPHERNVRQADLITWLIDADGHDCGFNWIQGD